MTLLLSGRLSLLVFPRAWFLGPVLFIIYINYVNGLYNSIIKFTVNTMISILVLTDEDRLSLQEAVHITSAWSERWEMLFNIEKCQALQVRTKN